MLGDFFRINLPYGIARNDSGEWYAFNREYMPLGFNEVKPHSFYQNLGLPIYTSYKGLTEKKLIAIAGGDVERIKRDEQGKICMVWLYNDLTNPQNNPKNAAKNWTAYIKKIKLLSKLIEDE